MEDILIGVVDRTITVFIPDPASTDGSGKTGLAHTDMTVSYTRVETDNDVVVTDVTSSLSALTNLTDAHADWGWKEVSSTLAPGLYRLDIADAVFASGAWYAVVYVMVTTSAAAATPKAFKLVAYNPLDGVRLGLTALPNANADAPGGLPISDAGGLDLDALNANVSSLLTNSNVIASGTIGATGNDTTNLHLDGLTFGEDEINDLLIRIYDVSASEYHARWIETWTLSGGELATVATLPFTPQASTDTYTIYAIRRNVDAVKIGANATAATNAATVFGGDFVDNYNTTANKWKADITHSNGVAIIDYDGTLAAVTADTDITFPATDAAGNSVPDDARYEYTILQLTGGTGAGQLMFLTTKTGTRKFAFVDAYTPVNPSTDTTYIVLGSWRSNVNQLSDDQTAADNAESFFDGTGYAGTNNVIPTVTTVTTTTNLTNAPTNGDLTATMKASVNTEVDTALADINLDHLVKIAVDTNFATTVHLDSVIGQIADNGTTATFDRTTDSLEVLGAATAPSAASIADAVWEEAIADHSGTVGSTAEALNAAGSAGDPWVTALPGAYGAGSAGYILGTNLNATISSRASQTSVDDIPTVAEFEARTIVAANYATASALDAVDNFVDTEIGTIITHLTDIKGATFSGATDSLEAIRDRGDSAWVTATGFSTLDAAGVRTAVGLASANLDTQLADLPTVAEFEARTLVAASYFDPATDTVANVTTVGSVTTKTGYSLAATGLDAVLIESGISAGAGLTNDTGTQLTSINARQAFSITISALGAVLAGAATSTITTKPAGKAAGNTRITATVDSDGNRSAITLKVPD